MPESSPETSSSEPLPLLEPPPVVVFANDSSPGDRCGFCRRRVGWFLALTSALAAASAVALVLPSLRVRPMVRSRGPDSSQQAPAGGQGSVKGLGIGVAVAVGEVQQQNDASGGSISNNVSNGMNFTDDGDGSCSCMNSHANRTCCRRSILRAHKFGFRLAAEWFGELRDSGDLVLTRTIELASIPHSNSAAEDYRHVVMVRNFTEAFVSGYLYHKSGRECWLSPEGIPTGTGRGEGLRSWGNAVGRFAKARTTDASSSSFGPYPDPGNRSLCRYLVEEDEEAGMKVYVAYALSTWYAGLLPYLQRTKGKGATAAAKANATAEAQGAHLLRTSFVCLEEASDPRRERDVYFSMIHFLYPGGIPGGIRHPFPEASPSDAGAGDANSSNSSGGSIIAPYDGPHATSHDPDLRLRLAELVGRLDGGAFGGRVAATDRLIGCRGTAA